MEQVDTKTLVDNYTQANYVSVKELIQINMMLADAVSINGSIKCPK